MVMSCPSLDEQTFFADHGWVVLRNIVSAQNLTAITKAFDRLTQGSAAGSIWQVPGMCSHNDLMLSHIRNGLGEFTANLLGAERVQLLQDTLIVKAARIGASIELHQDYAYTGFLEPPNAVSIRLSLTESTVESGCMYVIDHSHLWAHHRSMSLFSDRLQKNVAEKLPADLRALIEKERIPLHLKPGDVSIHHCLTYHGSYENCSDTVQKTIVAHLFDGDCRLVHERLSSTAVDLFRSDENGHLLTSSFPLLFEQ
jgi:ectoine hydroxylase-related dioxygenase (phytanoyl-CoA dioxygenase family)